MDESKKVTVRSMRGLLIGLGIFAAAVVILFLGLRTDFFARSVGRIASQRYLGGTRFSVGVERIEGSIFRNLTLKGVRLHYKGPGERFDLFRADEINVSYNLFAAMRHSHRIEDVSVTKSVLRLETDSTGTFILPAMGKRTGSFPSFEVERFSIDDAQAIVRRAEKSDAFNGVDLAGSLRSGGTELEIDLTRGSAANPDRYFALKRLKGGIAFIREAGTKNAAAQPATRVMLDSLAVVLEESAFTASGLIVPAAGMFDLTVDAEPIEVEEITRILRVETSHYGEVQGAFTLKGKIDRFRLNGRMNGVLSGYAMSDCGISLLREGDVIHIDSISGEINGAGVKGNGRYTLADGGVMTMDVFVHDLDLSRGFVPKKRLPETRFNGALKLDYRVRSQAISFALDLGEGDFLGFPFAEALVNGSYADDTLKATEVYLTHPTHTVNLHGTMVGGSAISFFFNVDCEARDTIFKYFNVEEYRADAKLNGRWEGTLDEWDLRMNGSCAGLEYHGALVPEGDVKLAIEMSGGKNPKYAVQFDLDGPGCSIGSARFDSLSLSLEYSDPATNIKKLLLSRDDFDADIAADVSKQGQETEIRFKECTLDALGETWIGGGDFAVFIADSLVRFEDIQLHSKAGAVYADGAVGTESKTIRGRLSFERLDLDLLNRGGLLRTPLGGQARGTILCSGSYADPDLDINVTAGSARIDTFLVDTLRAGIRYSNGRYIVDSLFAAAPSGSLNLAGEILGMPIREASSRPGAALRDASVAIESSCQNLELAPLLSLAGIRTFTGGRLNGSLAISDSLTHPLVSFKGRIDNLSTSSFRIPSIDCGVTVDRSALVAEGKLNLSRSSGGSFHGSMPLAPASYLYSLDGARPVAFALDLPEGDLADLPGLTDLVAEAAGRYSGQLEVSGTAGSPHLYGNFHLKNADFRLSGMEEKYNQVNATVLLDDTLVTISQLAGREGKKGTINSTGWATLRGWNPGEYRIGVNVNDFVLASFSDILAIVSGNVNIGARVVDGKAIPIISGSCVVRQSEVYYDLGGLSSSGTEGATEEPTWLAAIDLKMPGNTWIRTPDARIELQGNVTLYHDAKGTYLRGKLNLLRGWYNIYNNKFTITSGELQFVTAGSFRPVVDIEAETQDSEGRNIYLSLKWHQDDLQPIVTLTHEDSGYSETDIWKMLGGGVVTTEGGEASWNARGTAQNLAANYIERMLNSQMEGVTIELEADHDDDTKSGQEDFSDTKIAIGKYLSQG
ncbi:MAG: translocation/assembly module TamB domain-containing protein, partial [Candidatus Krumholzibacteria bacterium]|nr:translocation/assembly module TamB domain-containing protein [Candidatus Krumholzibacteria bacterium]